MKVYYGFSKLTPKVMRKPELAIYFENSSHNPSKNEEAMINDVDNQDPFIEGTTPTKETPINP